MYNIDKMCDMYCIYNFENLSWEEIKLNYKPELKTKYRPIILVDLDDGTERKYNAIIMGLYDKEIHIRYLDNPKIKKMYWWTGNSRARLGLDSDREKEYMKRTKDRLLKSDFVSDGYDDLINFEKQAKRFYRTTELYPYLNGLMGNVYVNCVSICESSKK